MKISSLNTELDKQIAAMQQLVNDMERSPRLPEGEPTIDMTLPALATRANKVLGFSSTGQPHAYDLSGGGPTSAENVNYLPAGAGAVGRTVQDKLREAVSVTDFGAVGDGVTDDTAALVAAAAAANGRPITVPPGDYVFSSTIEAKSLVLIGAHRKQVTLRYTGSAGSSAFLLTGNGTDGDGGVFMSGFRLTGPFEFPTYVANGFGIHVLGDDGNDRPQDYVFGDLEVDHFASGGLNIRAARDVWINRNIVHDCGLYGINVEGVRRVNVTENHVWTIESDFATGNAYGIAISWSTPGKSVASREAIVAFNDVFDVPDWEGIDIHGGDKLLFIGNTVRRCFQPIALIHGGSIGPASRITCALNSVSEPPPTGNREGILLAGNASNTQSIVTIALNQIDNYGSNDSNRPALRVTHCDSVKIVDNLIKNSTFAAMYFGGVGHPTTKVDATGNTIENVSRAGGNPIAILVDDSVTGVIDDLTVRQDSGMLDILSISAPASGSYGVEIGSSIRRQGGGTLNLFASTVSKAAIRASSGIFLRPTFRNVSNSQVVSTSMTSEETLATVSIPADAIGPSGRIQVRGAVSCENNTNVKTLRVKLNGTTVWTRLAASLPGLPIEVRTDFRAINSQVTVSHDGTVTTTAISASSAITLTVTSQKATAGDSLALEALTVEAFL